MAKVMVSIPDELLAQIDAEARRQGTTRSGLLQRAARVEVGVRQVSRDEVRAQLDGLSSDWIDPGEDITEAIRRDRRNH
ncbi:MAG TPA: ribbon-helix-helix protein, CopG family [Solirubrobacterales bacterium]|jgi:metal-responsive CopG/Arc/MetJ family transcriptional regulator|nr:type II toxin-antitoxin system HicB family antitoxin [Solirubrobacterales bacterium]HMU25851.1 ribbon-helix-helix protein, CopG family [Solirubrobacterales bacterium]HMX70242.1 ribbon-helix-helix protein, CopG family [Solirubrobacterales bacterium]HMY24795.1 ribbon-helix-helix protein, CopG family [Solirubrobacterales bacterium]HNA24443.1 ribbon-helix-helix protein, CopG family [Solirubrobacterales bacterium]